MKSLKTIELDQMILLYEETKRRLDELTILYEMTKISHSALNFDQMIHEILQSLNHFFNFERLSILLVEEYTGQLILHPSSIGFSFDKGRPLRVRVGEGIIGWVAEHKVPLLVNDVRNDSRYIDREEGILSEICVPIINGGKLIGVIDAQSKKLNAFSKEDVHLLEKAGIHLASIIENVISEERYRNVVESALDGVLVMGEGFRVTYVNERLAELLDLPREELMGVDFLEFLNGKSRQMMMERDKLLQKGEEVPPRVEIDILRKNGEIRNVEMSCALVRDYHGNTNRIAFLKDITEKRKMEEQLFQAEKLRAIGEMASGVAHDFNNALAIILGNAQLLLFNAKESEQIKSLRIIEKVARESSQTVRRLLEFTKNKTKGDLYMVDVNTIVREAIEMTRPKWRDEAQGKGMMIDLVTQLGEVSPALGNGPELKEVITHMIFNAIEAMPKGGRIEIKTIQGEGRVHVQISDTGIGMPEEVRKKVFEPFFTTKPFTNSGLGLSMAYGIIKRFGGEIEVESEQEKGSTFTITLGLGAKEERECLRDLKQPAKEIRILVIDDEAHVREFLSRGLSKFNYQVMEACSGEHGIHLFKKETFDLVLTDLGMPDLSGWEVCKRIKSMRPGIPVGMITGWGADVDLQKKGEGKVDFIISKPFDFNQILRIIAETVDPKAIHPIP